MSSLFFSYSHRRTRSEIATRAMGQGQSTGHLDLEPENGNLGEVRSPFRSSFRSDVLISFRDRCTVAHVSAISRKGTIGSRWLSVMITGLAFSLHFHLHFRRSI